MNPNLPDFPSLVYTRLFFGKDRAVKIGDLAESMQVSRRVIEKAIEELRASGRPICTGSVGCWLTTSEDELIAQYRALRARYIHQAVNARELLRTAQRYAKPEPVKQTTLPWSDAA